MGRRPAIQWLRSSPTLSGRCWCACAPRSRHHRVAILTDPRGDRCWLAPSWASRGSPWPLRSSPTLSGRCWHPGARWTADRAEGCDPHRPSRAGAGSCRCVFRRVSTQLRSSPTLSGRCWTRSPDCADHVTKSCDPHRPSRAGAGAAARPAVHGNLSGCDPHRPSRVGAGAAARSARPRQRAVAILTDPRRAGAGAAGRTPAYTVRMLRSSPTLSGRCLPVVCRLPSTYRGCDPHRPSRAGAGDLRRAVSRRYCDVAILTDPLGPVLAGAAGVASGRACRWLRSSPTLSGRCWRGRPGPDRVSRSLLRSSPTLSGRCWRVRGQWLVSRLRAVAILTDPLGPVLGGRRARHGHTVNMVAILTDPLGPVLAAARAASSRMPWRCDPHRPSRAGAGGDGWLTTGADWRCDPHRPSRAGAGTSGAGFSSGRRLRSSPTLSGRCWVDREVRRCGHDRLRSSPTLGGRCWRSRR